MVELMAQARKFGSITPNASETHRQWLALVDCEGPFLAIPSLKRVWSAGIPDFRTNNTDRFSILVDARKRFETAWEALDRAPGDEGALEKYREKRDEWVETVLRDVIGWSESLQWGPVPGVEAKSPNQVVSVAAQAALVGPDGIGAIVHVIDPTDSLRETPSDVWAATPIDRVEAMLRQSGISIGVVTDGRWWGVVHATTGFMPASGIVDALTWTEEPRTRDAFFTLLSRQQLVGGEPNDRLAALFVESIAAAEEITEALGSQVRQAVELLVQSFSESAAEAKRREMSDPLPERPHEIYEAAVTIMMRIVFLLFAEERGLLPTGELFEHGYGIAGELDRLMTVSTSGEEVLDISSLTWHRLLATSRALFQGASFENLRMPAYGGSLFDPNRFSFLTASNENGSLSVSVNDRVMLHVLESVQVANLKGEARRISFRDIDVEQIGYIYEGLLGYTCVRVDEPILGIIGKTGVEPEIPLSLIEEFASANSKPKQLADAFIAWVKEDQPSAQSPSSAALSKAFAVEVDAVTISALSQSVGGDEELKKRITPWLGAVRTDLRGQPFVVRAGGLLVAETPSRKNAGAHYTPKSLAEEVVLYALQPLCYSPGPHQTSNESEWKLKSSDDILNLKIADIACGSGAFLVAAARYLSDRLVEAWIDEDSANRLRRDLHVKAVRQVVANCLYGADINDMAVEMCKLSLWLVSLDRNLPFSFVDDKIFLGNSLLGITSLDQLRSLHIDPSRVPVKVRLDFPDVDIDSIVAKAVELRENLATEIDESDPARTSVSKQRQLAEFHRVTNDLRRIADGVIAAGLPLGGKPGNHLDEAYSDLRLAVKSAFPDDGKPSDAKWLDGLIERGLTPSVNTDYERWQPLHWVVEAPDVMVDHGGFDAVIGNPPFLGGQKITGAMGESFRDWLISNIADGARGSADLVAYFFIRAWRLIGQEGVLGLIATNSIAQGFSREIALDRMIDGDFTITRAVRSEPWPAASANLEYAAVWGTRLGLGSGIAVVADGVSAKSVSSLLEPTGGVDGAPITLTSNSGIAFQGCIVLGQGFVLDQSEANELINANQENSKVIRQYLNGRDLNSSPNFSASRFVIDFDGMSESSARKFPMPFKRVERLVKPERQRRNREGNFVVLESRARNWWQFGARASTMRSATSTFDEVVVIAQVSRTLMPARVKADQVLDAKLVVFASDSFGLQAVLSSSMHQDWVIKYGTRMRDDPTYTPTTVFENFPLPPDLSKLDSIGEKIHFTRSEIMIRRNFGLTPLYNLVNLELVNGLTDPDVEEIRRLHGELDLAVVDAYGWSDILLEHGIHDYRGVTRWTWSPAARIEILDRLLAENHRRAALESSDSTPVKKPKKPKPPPAGMEAMF
jgi:hypothetical protein